MLNTVLRHSQFVSGARFDDQTSYPKFSSSAIVGMYGPSCVCIAARKITAFPLSHYFTADEMTLYYRRQRVAEMTAEEADDPVLRTETGCSDSALTTLVAAY